MADVLTPSTRTRRESSLSRRRRDDLWIATTALIAAMIALPLARTSWHGPEVAAVLAVGATAMLAGQRWAIAVVVLAELLLLPTMWPRAFFGDHAFARVTALIAIGAVVPGVLATRRAAAALVLITGWRRTSAVCRRFHAVMIGIGVIALSSPLF